MFSRLGMVAGAALLSCGLAGTVSAAEFTMRLAGTTPKAEQNFAYAPFEILAQEVEARSGGRIKVELYPGGQLGGIESIVNQISDGTIQGGDPSDGHLATSFPEIQVFGIPYLFVSRDVAWDVLDGPFGQKMREMMIKKTGMRPLFWSENGGFRHYTSSKREMKSVADMVGLKMRTMNHPLHMEIAASLGMSPTPIAWTEVYTSLQTGVVDGQENSIPTFLVPKLYEVQKFMILDGHVYALTTMSVNEAWYQSLPDDLKHAVDQSARIALTANRGLSVSNEMVGRAYLESQGVKIYDPSPADKKAFRERAQPKAIAWLKGQIDPALVDEMIAAVADSEKRLGYR